METIGLLIFIVFLIALIIFGIILYDVRINDLKKRLEDCDCVIEDMIRIMGRDSYDEFCNYCGGCYYFYKFKSSAKMKNYSKSSGKK